jgi:hypothetical protein
MEKVNNDLLEDEEPKYYNPSFYKSAYQFFRQKNYGQIKAKNPNMAYFQLTAALKMAWKKLDEIDKAEYNALAKEDYERYKNRRLDLEKEGFVPRPPPQKLSLNRFAKRIFDKMYLKKIQQDFPLYTEDEQQGVRILKSPYRC